MQDYMDDGNNNAPLRIIAAEQFSQGVADLLLSIEELRQATTKDTGSSSVVVTDDMLHAWQWQMDHVYSILPHLERWCADVVGCATSGGTDSDATRDMLLHCLNRAAMECYTVWQRVLQEYQEPVVSEAAHDSIAQHNNNDTEDMESSHSITERQKRGQGAVARITEIQLHLNRLLRRYTGDKTIVSSQDINSSYANYQRQVLRKRAKPAIAALVQERQKGIFNPDNAILSNTKSAPLMNATVLVLSNSNDDDDGENGDNFPSYRNNPLLQQHHAPVMTLVLGETATLLHPLAAWRTHVQNQDAELNQLCIDSMKVLDEQARLLVKTVSDWFWEDRSTPTQNGETSFTTEAVALLECRLQELADASVVLQGYQTFRTTLMLDSCTDFAQLVQEWACQYGALERECCQRQWQLALQEATPVVIVVGTDICVPSTVEDAHYLTQRALQRAQGIMSVLPTVATAMARDMWSCETNERDNSEIPLTVYQALLQQIGCWSRIVHNSSTKHTQQKQHPEKQISPPPSSGFASALLEALDDDNDTQLPTSSQRAPSSGNFLSSLLDDNEKQQERDLDTLFCLLNGIQAASTASRSLASILMVEDDDNSNCKDKLEHVRQEYRSFAESYQTLLQEKINSSLSIWCSECLYQHLTSFFVKETYLLDEVTIGLAEDDDRLKQDLLRPLQSSRFIQQLTLKCDAHVLQIISQTIAKVMVENIVQTLLERKNAQSFTDWGSLLLSKQVRLLQTFCSQMMLSSQSMSAFSSLHDNAIITLPATAHLLHIWERLLQAVTVLQLEKPSDWLLYYSQSTSVVLQPDELSRILLLRVDFKADAIQSVIASIMTKTDQSTNKVVDSDSRKANAVNDTAVEIDGHISSVNIK